MNVLFVHIYVEIPRLFSSLTGEISSVAGRVFVQFARQSLKARASKSEKKKKMSQ